MATIVLVHGAGGRASQWFLVAPLLEAAGHEVLAVDLPCDEGAPLSAYVDSVVEAVGDRRGDLVLVAQSLAGLVAPLVCERVPVDLMVLLAAMVPVPGETGGEWWSGTGHAEAMAAQHLTDDSEEAVFLHDVPPEVLAVVEPPRDQDGVVFEDPSPMAAWPAVPTRFLLCRDDRFFPADWLRGVVRERLGIEPDEIPGGHCAYLSRPEVVAASVLSCWADVEGARRDGQGAEGHASA